MQNAHKVLGLHLVVMGMLIEPCQITHPHDSTFNFLPIVYQGIIFGPIRCEVLILFLQVRSTSSKSSVFCKHLVLCHLWLGDMQCFLMCVKNHMIVIEPPNQ